ncbi:hypothetical protein MIMGU_mgv1a020894mg [Erythranthe guttata]|uniref:Alliinase C-terminal domain-containing protein n=1 Tax=Erythranthe guttata TaxID=4155 RepID=A0A022QCV6_ERYGU|nr:hypothetical protein MIMGU_mgv1a020894mg [Erythranthe guttata]
MYLILGLLLLASVALNLFFITNQYYLGTDQLKSQKLSWSLKAAAEAEAVASISCSGHGRAFLDGLIVDGKPICECNTCYGGSDCSLFSPDCSADANSGDPLFLEPFWMEHAASSAVLISGWHRMSYTFYDKSFISQQLENHVRRVHEFVRDEQVSYTVFYFQLYKFQTNYFENKRFKFDEDTSLSSNSSYNTEANVIEFEAVSQGPLVKVIYDHAYYWPHFSAIPSPANEDVMIFTMSKLTGHAGSRIGWALIKDEQVYEDMNTYISISEMGISREAQLRALQLVKAILNGNGTDIFDYAYEKMSYRWKKLSEIVSLSSRFSIQEIPPLFCNFFEKVRGPSPAYAWVKCEREEDTNCNEVLRAGNILGREGSLFSVEDRYVRLSLLKSDYDFNLLMDHLSKLVAEENGAKTA